MKKYREVIILLIGNTLLLSSIVLNYFFRDSWVIWVAIVGGCFMMCANTMVLMKRKKEKNGND